MIRIGYSVFCWIVAILTYLSGILNYGWIKEKFFPGDLHSTIAEFYFFAGIPMLFSVAIIQLFIRPAYILAISDIYGRYISGKGENFRSKSAACGNQRNNCFRGFMPGNVCCLFVPL